MNAMPLPRSLSDMIDGLYEELELAQSLWQQNGDIHSERLVLQMKAQIESHREARRKKVRTLTTLKQVYRGKSVKAIIVLSETRLREIDLEILKWQNEVSRLEAIFSEDMLQHRLPNYALMHTANVGLALEEDTRAVAVEEFGLILDYKTGRGTWYSRLMLYLRKKFTFTPSFYKQSV